MGPVVARMRRHGCDRRGIGVWYGTGQPQTDNRPRARSLGSIWLIHVCIYTRSYSRHTHILSFRYVAVNQVLSRGGRVLIRERQERGNARNRIAFPHRRRRRLVSAWLRRRINRDSILRRRFSPRKNRPSIQEDSRIFARTLGSKKLFVFYRDF